MDDSDSKKSSFTLFATLYSSDTKLLFFDSESAGIIEIA